MEILWSTPHETQCHTCSPTERRPGGSEGPDSLWSSVAQLPWVKHCMQSKAWGQKPTNTQKVTMQSILALACSYTHTASFQTCNLEQVCFALPHTTESRWTAHSTPYRGGGIVLMCRGSGWSWFQGQSWQQSPLSGWWWHQRPHTNWGPLTGTYGACCIAIYIPWLTLLVNIIE